MLITKYPSAYETQFMCSECSEAIINPLCPVCLTTEIEAWLTLYPNLGSHLLPKLHEYLEKNTTKNKVKCIICKNKKTSICPYCFTKHVLKELKEVSAGRIVLKEFFEFFNFDFHHTGYSKEAEKLGII